MFMITFTFKSCHSMSQSIRYLFIFASQTKQSSIILSNLTNILDNEKVLNPIGLYALCRRVCRQQASRKG